MLYLMYMFLVVVVLGAIGVASNPSPSFAALSLVLTAGGGCSILAFYGGCFLSLVLFLIYLGGMLVVFAYSVAFTVNLNPVGWGNQSILSSVTLYLVGVGAASLVLVSSWGDEFWAVGGVYKEWGGVRENIVAVSSLYFSGGGLLVIGACALLLVLFIVLMLVRGSSWGALRVV